MGGAIPRFHQVNRISGLPQAAKPRPLQNHGSMELTIYAPTVTTANPKAELVPNAPALGDGRPLPPSDEEKHDD